MEKVIVVVGPTSVGKTALAVQLAKTYNGEIISGDSIQFYKKLNIGSAKVTLEEQAGIPHHLIDFLELSDNYSVANFQKDCRKLISEITKRGKVPIICGGTGLYIKAVLYDYEFKTEEKDPVITERIAKLDPEGRYVLLQELDYATSETIHPNNQQRVMRALEMALMGQSKSAMIAEQEHKLLYDVCMIGLTLERSRLYERINYRVDVMMERGLLAELDDLVSDPLSFTYQGMQGIGYKEFKPYYDGEIALEEVLEKIKKNSRNFAKRQFTWFNNQMDVTYFDIEEPKYLDSINNKVKQFLESE